MRRPGSPIFSFFSAVFWVSLVLVVGGAKSARSADWTDHARRFTGESDRVRENAIQALRKDKKLADKLKKAFGSTDHFLALDVIAVLRLRSLVPYLMQVSEKDRTGYSYHALNAILIEKEIPKITELYKQRLMSPHASPAARMALLDSLSRLQAELDIPTLEKFLKDESPEVRSSTLYFVRNALLRHQRKSYLPLFAISLGDEAFQMRLQALHALSEMPLYLRVADHVDLIEPLKKCLKDPVPQVKAFCEEFVPPEEREAKK